MREQTTPGILALRIQLDSRGRIRTVDVYDVRAEVTGARGGTITLMRPPLPVEWQGVPLGAIDPLFTQGNFTEDLPGSLVDNYFDDLQRRSSAGVPLAAACVRRDNGRLLSNVSCADQMDGRVTHPNGLFNTTGAVRDRRVLVRDRQRGVVLAVAMVDNYAIPTSNTTLPPTQRVPSTYMVPQLIKVVGGRIVRLEGMVKWMPYGYWPF